MKGYSHLFLLAVAVVTSHGLATPARAATALERSASLAERMGEVQFLKSESARVGSDVGALRGRLRTLESRASRNSDSRLDSEIAKVRAELATKNEQYQDVSGRLARAEGARKELAGHLQAEQVQACLRVFSPTPKANAPQVSVAQRMEQIALRLDDLEERLKTPGPGQQEAAQEAAAVLRQCDSLESGGVWSDTQIAERKQVIQRLQAVRSAVAQTASSGDCDAVLRRALARVRAAGVAYVDWSSGSNDRALSPPLPSAQEILGDPRVARCRESHAALFDQLTREIASSQEAVRGPGSPQTARGGSGQGAGRPGSGSAGGVY